ncbi:MAG: A/G-specific adenine glycosylase [Bacteroidota bacterium]|nr:A/G-specific adenine glycosylase [Bacteroidota bacterium]
MKFGETFSSTKLIIQGWYEKNLRDLPMRQTRDPYHTWVAEVIMQQTRIDQGLPYLADFLKAFPDVKALASAREDEVLRKWQGLGYYSRARNLHASARHVVEQLGGEMPGDYRGLLGLKGVGPYTAAAIASWCYNEPCAAVDGNVSRVIARLFGIEEAINAPAGEKQVQDLANVLLDRANPGRHNQAMIDFGAMQCVPVSPPCMDCPLSEECEANLQGRVDQIPVKIKNKKPVDRWFYYYMIRSDGNIILIQRGEKDIWAGLYELPSIETNGPRPDEEILQEILDQVRVPVRIGKLSAPVRHQLSHQTIHARFLHVEVDLLPHPLPANWQCVALEQLDNFAMPRLILRHLESSNF